MSTSYIVKTGYHVMKETSFLELPVTIVVLLSVAIFTSSYSMQQSANAILTRNGGEVVSSDFVKAPIATSGDNVYTAWPNNDTGHWGVFFAKSADGGKSLGKTIMLSAPNKGHVVDLNVDIAASGNNVLVTWWTNKTGALMPVFKASNDNGNTFGKTMILNSTSVP
jgi:hypothetical protein